MGALLSFSYLEKPITEKESSDECNEVVRCGVSSMQGWRLTQEDAHNCLINYDTNISLFAVYDGHGGHEVAEYCAQNLPDFIKATAAYKQAEIDYKKALIDSFLGFDATIATPEIVEVLKEIASVKNTKYVSDSESESDIEENVANLYEEASMPIEQVIEKYQTGVKVTKSPKKQSGECSSSSSASSSGASSSQMNQKKAIPETSDDSSKTKISSNSETNVVSSTSSEVSCSESVSTTTTTSNSDNLEKNEVIPDQKLNDVETSHQKKNEVETEQKINEVNTTNQKPNDVDTKEETKSNCNACDSSVPQENGEISPSSKLKGKTLIKKGEKKAEVTSSINLRDRSAQKSYEKLLEEIEEDESDSDDDKDATFVVSNSSSEADNDDEQDDDDDGNDDDDDDEEEDDDDEAENEEDVECEEEKENEGDNDSDSMDKEPGYNSGCTAVVALLVGNELYVANAGDSRCVVCRNGQAIEMSFDHKPEDKPERERVKKAGGEIIDGRVNGGLNLSRAIGDHAYKQSKDLSAEEQMITALPDVKTLTINPDEDEFMVLACDGIWNFMQSQDVVDFIRKRLEIDRNCKLSEICEAMFDHCLAPHTFGDGTGCDNMTGIIVQFKNRNNTGENKEADCMKRSASPDEDVNIKRAKTDD